MTVFPERFPRRSFKPRSSRNEDAAAGARIAAHTMGLAILLSGVTSAARAQQSRNLLTNGNFETGTFAKWTVANMRSPDDVNNTRNFYINAPGTATQPVSNSPSNSFSFNTAQNAQPGGGGNFYAVTASDAPGQSALLQTFTTPTTVGGLPYRLTFSFDLFVNDQSGYSSTFQDSTGLDYTTGGAFRNNQYARVDLLRSSSSDFSTDAADVLFNVPLNVPVNDDPNTTPNPYQRYRVDLSPYVSAGTQYKIRFAEVDNLAALHLGVDNASIVADITPEPTTLALALPFLGVAPLLSFRLRRNHNNGRSKAAQN